VGKQVFARGRGFGRVCVCEFEDKLALEASQQFGFDDAAAVPIGGKSTALQGLRDKGTPSSQATRVLG